jgi:hypothetical protein
MVGLKQEVLMNKRMEITSFKLENKHKKTTRGRQDGFYLQEDLLLGYFQG